MHNIDFKKSFKFSVFLILVPLIGSLVVEGWNWNIFDFIFAFVFFFIANLVYQFALAKIESKNKKVFIIFGLTILFVYIWAELAVGIFTNFGS